MSFVLHEHKIVGIRSSSNRSKRCCSNMEKLICKDGAVRARSVLTTPYVFRIPHYSITWCSKLETVRIDMGPPALATERPYDQPDR